MTGMVEDIGKTLKQVEESTQAIKKVVDDVQNENFGGGDKSVEKAVKAGSRFLSQVAEVDKDIEI